MKKHKKVRERFITAHVMLLSEDLTVIVKGLHPYGCPAPDFDADAIAVVKESYASLVETHHGKSVRVVVDIIADQIIDPDRFNH